MELNAKDIFIGKSLKNKMTTFSRGYGNKFDGNTILLEMDTNEYIFIGQYVESFKSLSKIIYYASPIGNSGCPYPYAIDDKGNYYLLLEDVVMMCNELIESFEDPYELYYDGNSFNLEETSSVKIKPFAKTLLYTNDE
jgi:hypothetical protein